MVDDTTISEDMRQYNYVTTERLAGVYPGVDKKYADRTREVSTCHLIVSAYKNDPHGKANRGPNTPETTFKVRIRYYGAWDLSKAEYDELFSPLPDMSLVDYSPDDNGGAGAVMTEVILYAKEEKVHERSQRQHRQNNN